MRTVRLLTVAAALLAASASAQDAKQWLPFLLDNRENASYMPLSYSVFPWNYFAKVPDNEKLHNYENAHKIPQCNNEMVQPEQMDAYEFQTETWLTTLGTDIYDAGVWCMAVTLLGEAANCTAYLENVLLADKTIQFGNIRGNQACGGIEYFGQCPENSASCGFCYGDQAQTMPTESAYFFRMIGNYWAIQGTVDARCPHLNHMWTWNDYKPVLGENAWAQLLAPAQHAMMIANFTPSAIPDDAPLFKLAIPFLTALQAMKAGDTGAFYYTPWNTWFNFSHASEAIGATFSIENQGSLLAGLEALEYILQNKPSSAHASSLSQVQGFIAGLKTLLVGAWDSNNKFFRQGGTYNKTTQEITWTQNGQPEFAVDCQTWVGAVLGPQYIDKHFGALASYNLWQTVKQYGGWQCPNGDFCGVGYTFNNMTGGQVFSGEWTYGAVNWLQVMVADGNYNASIVSDLQYDIQMMNFGLETYLWTAASIDNSTKQYNSVKYSNKRYYIPFGWWANDIPATASTAWAALVQSNYNPFNVNRGSYKRYPTA